MFTRRVIQIISIILFLSLLTSCGLFPGEGLNDDETPTPIPDGGGYPGDGDGYTDPPDDGGDDPAPPDNGDPDPNDDEPDPSTGNEPTSLGEPTMLPSPQSSQLTIGETVEHTVTQGEWLVQIARCYGTTATAVLNANSQLFNSNFILPGTKVTVPDVGSEGPIYQRPCASEAEAFVGDTWGSLAEKYGTTAELLSSANPGSLFAGRTILVPSNQVDTQQAANPKQDLIYVREGNLAIWQSENGETAVYESFNNQVVELAVNDAGTWAIAKVGQEESETVNVALINLVEKNMVVVASDLPLTVSAINQTTMMINDQLAAFVTVQETDLTLNTFSIENPSVVNTLEGLTHNISTDFVPNIHLFEGAGENSLLLFDASGVYQYASDLTGGEQVVWQPEGDQDFGTSLWPLAWSPDDQYLLLQVFYIEGFSYGLLDLSTNQWAPIENSGGYVIAGTAVWQSDGHIDVINPWIAGGAGFTLTTYQPQTIDGNLVISEVSQDELGLPAGLPANSLPGTFLRSGPINDGEIYVSYQQSDPDSLSHQILRLDRENKQLVEHMDVDSFPFWQTYSNDGKVLLMQQIANNSTVDQVVYVDMVDKVTFSILDLVGPDSHNFNWID